MVVVLWGAEEDRCIKLRGKLIPGGQISNFSVQVKAILVNIFGGIVNCATIANGIIAACKEIQLSIPLVVRLEGIINFMNT